MSEAKPLSLSKYYGLTSEHVVAQAFWVTTFAILTAVGAQIEIPHQPVPYTFQTLFVMISGAVIGKRNAFLSMALYLLLGIVGLPVFSGGGFGLARIFGPTGGYLVAFPIASWVIGYLVSLRPEVQQDEVRSVRSFLASYGWTFGAMLIGLVIIFSFGTTQLNFVYFRDWNAAFQSGFLIFSSWDVLKLCAATAISVQVRKR